MSFNLKNRSFLSLRDFTAQEISFPLKLDADLKAAKYAGTEQPTLRGGEIALIFEKNSTGLDAMEVTEEVFESPASIASIPAGTFTQP